MIPVRNKLVTAIFASIMASNVVAADYHLEEIVVTAQKKSESLHDTPVTVNALSGSQLDENISFDIEDIQKLTSGLKIQNTGNRADVVMRGIGSKLDSATSARVTTYYDGSYVRDQTTVFLTQYDMSRVEILRGPQGTLYGQSSPTGAIVMYPKKPSLEETEGYIRQSFGEHDLSNTQFAYGIPLIEGVLGLRVSGVYDENNSTGGENAFTGSDHGKRTRSGRAILTWEPTDTLSTSLNISHTERTNNGETPVFGNGILKEDRKSVSDTDQVRKSEVSTVILGIDWDVGFADLSFQSLYTESDNFEFIDLDVTDTPYQTIATDFQSSRDFNQEIRLSSTGNDKWDWIVGVYYDEHSSTVTADSREEKWGSIPLPIPGSPYLLPLSTSLEIESEYATEGYGIFTHNTFFVTDDLSITAGLRWNKKRNSVYTPVDKEAIATLPAALGGGTTTVLSTSEVVADDLEKYMSWTGTVKALYTINEDHNIFLTFDRGGRAGGVSLDYRGGATTFDPSLLDYDPETANSVELGYKGKFMDSRMSLAASLYRTVYKDFQIDASAHINDGPSAATQTDSVFFIDNAKEVIAQGLDVEMSLLLTENLKTSVSISYNDTKFEDYSNAPCRVDGAIIPAGDMLTCDLSGEIVGGLTSKWSSVVSVQYGRELSSIGAEWYMAGLMNYNSSRTGTFNREETGGFSTFDLNAGLRTDSWDVKLWVKNVFDKDATILPSGGSGINIPNPAAVPFTPAAGQELLVDSGYSRTGQYTNPRQVGVTATYNF